MNRFIIIIICIASSLIMGIFLILPKYENYTLLADQIKSKQNEFDSKEEYLGKLYETAEKIDAYQEKIVIMDSALPDEPSLPNLLNFLQISASQNGLALHNISKSQSLLVEGSNLKFTKMGIVLAGPYRSLQGLIEKLEKSSRLIAIENIDFSSPQPNGIFDFKLNIKLFHY